VALAFHLILVAGLGFEPRMAKAYETLLVTGPFPHYKVVSIEELNLATE